MGYNVADYVETADDLVFEWNDFFQGRTSFKPVIGEFKDIFIRALPKKISKKIKIHRCRFCLELSRNPENISGMSIRRLPKLDYFLKLAFSSFSFFYEIFDRISEKVDEYFYLIDAILTFIFSLILNFQYEISIDLFLSQKTDFILASKCLSDKMTSMRYFDFYYEAENFHIWFREFLCTRRKNIWSKN